MTSEAERLAAFDAMQDAWEAFRTARLRYAEACHPAEQVIVAKRLAALDTSPGAAGRDAKHNTLAVRHGDAYAPVGAGSLQFVWERYLPQAWAALQAVNGSALLFGEGGAVTTDEAKRLADGLDAEMRPVAAAGVGVRLKGGPGVRVKADAA